jgi:DNA-binding GntR family transcriptional regulator
MSGTFAASTLTDKAEDAILKLITSGEVAVGTRLSIRRLSTALHFGFAPVQDALKRLERDGWVTIIGWPHPPTVRGTYVLRTK